MAIRAAHQQGDLPESALNRCLRCLRPKQVYPQSQMTVAGITLGRLETHTAWCDLLKAQPGDPAEMDPEVRRDLEKRVVQYVARARAERGKGPCDSRITQPETSAIIHDWDPSPSMPGDLIPRAAYHANHTLWLELVWNLQLLTGPGALALRPDA